MQLVQPIPSLELLPCHATLTPSPVSHSPSPVQSPQVINISRKRPERGSPVFSPTQQTRSPAQKFTKLQRMSRARTEKEGGKEAVHPTTRNPTSMIPTHDIVTNKQILSTKSLGDFAMSPDENQAFGELQEELFEYMLKKVAVSTRADPASKEVFISLQDYFQLTRVTHTEKSKVAYLEVIDAKSDSKDVHHHRTASGPAQ